MGQEGGIQIAGSVLHVEIQVSSKIHVSYNWHMSIVGNQHPEPHHRLYPWNLFWPDSTSVFSLCAI